MNTTQIVLHGAGVRQKAMIASPARVVWIGTGTKVGKTTALAVLTAQGVARGEKCLWVGPWFSRARTGLEMVRKFLQPLIERGDVNVNETLLRIRSVNGREASFVSGDNVESIFGDNVNLVVIDEASRQPEKVFTAALTVTSATRGKIRLAFNLELGAKNWAIRNLLRVQAMTPEERRRASEDFMTFPTDPALVPPELIEAMRSQMPEPLWRALYLGEIPESDVSLFRNLDGVFTGQELAAPEPGHSYIMGADVARKTDFTVGVVIDRNSGDVVAVERFHEISWTLQYQRLASLYGRFRCSKAWVDETGLGDPVADELRKLGMNVEGVVFTAQSRKTLIEQLVVACDAQAIRIPPTPAFRVFRHELESFEIVFGESGVKYRAPASAHDDCVMALALAVHGVRSGGGVLGWISLLKNLVARMAGHQQPQAVLEEVAPARPTTTMRPSVLPPPPKLPPCPDCQSVCVIRVPDGWHCNSCGSQFGPRPAVLRAGFFGAGGRPGVRLQ